MEHVEVDKLCCVCYTVCMEEDMTLSNLEEREDGSGSLQVELEPEEMRVLLEYAIQTLLIKAMNEADRRSKGE